MFELFITAAVAAYVFGILLRATNRYFQASPDIEQEYLGVIRDALLEEDKRKNDDPVAALELETWRWQRSFEIAFGQTSPADQVEAFDEKPKNTEFVLGDDGELIEVPLRRFEEEEA